MRGFVVTFGDTTLSNRTFATLDGALKCGRTQARRGKFATVSNSGGYLIRVFKPRQPR